MSSLSLFSILPLAVTAIFWPSRFSKPGIPKFILDTKHPWIEENLAALRGLDAKDALCNPGSVLRADLPLLPKDLFANISIKNKREPAWKHAGALLQEIEDCPAALTHCESLHIDIHLQALDRELGIFEPSNPSDTLPHLLIDVLSNMPSLRKVTWVADSAGAEAAADFRTALQERNISLPTVKELHIGPHLYFLIHVADRVEKITASMEAVAGSFSSYRLRTQSQPTTELLQAISKVNHVRDLSLEMEWGPESLMQVLNSAPNIEVLRLCDASDMWWLGPRIQQYEDFDSYLKSLIPALAQFRRFTSLHFPSVLSLNLGLDGGPACGNAYMGRHGTKYLRLMHRERLWAYEYAAKLFLDRRDLALSMLTIDGDSNYSQNRTTDGQLLLPWTGRLKEYLLNEVPRYIAGSHRGADGDDVTEDPNGPLFNSWKEDERFLHDDWMLNDGWILDDRHVLEGNAKMRARPAWRLWA